VLSRDLVVHADSGDGLYGKPGNENSVKHYPGERLLRPLRSFCLRAGAGEFASPQFPLNGRRKASAVCRGPGFVGLAARHQELQTHVSKDRSIWRCRTAERQVPGVCEWTCELECPWTDRGVPAADQHQWKSQYISRATLAL